MKVTIYLPCEFNDEHRHDELFIYDENDNAVYLKKVELELPNDNDIRTNSAIFSPKVEEQLLYFVGARQLREQLLKQLKP